MTLVIEPGDPRHPDATGLLEQSHALMQSLFEPETNHYLSIDALCAPHIRFFIARSDGAALGCGALALKDGYTEIKSMFVAPQARGSGLGHALIEHLESAARAEGSLTMKLETGAGLDAAHALYRAHGFSDCGPFGDYLAGPENMFMEKAL